MTPAEKAIKRVDYFEQMYGVFRSFFADRLKKDDSPYGRYSLHRQANTFDDLELHTLITPVFASGVSTPDEKKAVARTALYDALVAHTYGQVFEGVASELGRGVEEVTKRLGEVERRLNKLAEKSKIVPPQVNPTEVPSAQV